MYCYLGTKQITRWQMGEPIFGYDFIALGAFTGARTAQDPDDREFRVALEK